ncbi:MAG: HAMP domain-containing sensor histidine kinase [Psychrobacillus sp.]
MREASFYEKMIPEIETKVHMEEDSILEVSQKEKLDSIIPSEGFKYKVIDLGGTYTYGNHEDQSGIDVKQIYERLNLVDYSEKNYFVKYIPILDATQDLKGVVMLYYQLKVTPIEPSDTLWLRAGIPLILFTPFFYIILFTVIFVRRFSREIKSPLEQLTVATTLVQKKDLNFEINHFEKIKEIKLLIKAFDNMRLELGDSLQREWKLQKERKEAIAALAHDLRTPLTIIQGHVEGLEEAKKKDIDRFDRYLIVIKTNIQRAVKLVNDLNQTSLLEDDFFQLDKKDFNPVTFLHGKIEEYGYWCRKEQIMFTSDIQDKRIRNTDFFGDSDRISQVLDNLFTNSLRFVQQGEISLEALITDEYLHIQLADNGPGFEIGKEAKVFQSFYQGITGESRRNGHAGLGLYIAKTIIDKHEGTIKAHNMEEGGAIVSINLPYI